MILERLIIVLLVKVLKIVIVKAMMIKMIIKAMHVVLKDTVLIYPNENEWKKINK